MRSLCLRMNDLCGQPEGSVRCVRCVFWCQGREIEVNFAETYSFLPEVVQIRMISGLMVEFWAMISEKPTIISVIIGSTGREADVDAWFCCRWQVFAENALKTLPSVPHAAVETACGRSSSRFLQEKPRKLYHMYSERWLKICLWHPYKIGMEVYEMIQGLTS